MHQGCSKFVMPGTNVEYWESKLFRNRSRDAENKIKLEQEGWNVLIVWECQLKKEKASDTLSKLCEAIRKARV